MSDIYIDELREQRSMGHIMMKEVIELNYELSCVVTSHRRVLISKTRGKQDQHMADSFISTLLSLNTGQRGSSN